MKTLTWCGFSALLGLLVVGSTTRIAYAQAAVDEAREAFSTGLAAESEGRADVACVEFRRSLRLVRELGPLRKTAACDEREGKLVDAMRGLEELLQRIATDDPDRASIEAQLTAIRGRVGHLKLVIAADAPQGMRVLLDGVMVAVPADDIVLDPRAHEVLVDAPGRPTRRVRIELAEGAAKLVTLPPPEEASAPKVLTPTAPRPIRERSNAPWIAGWIAGGVGLAGFVVAGTTGIKLLSDESELHDCRAEVGCDPVPIAESADPLLAINAIAWGVGAVGVGVGATLLIVDAVGDADVEADVGVGSANVRLRF